MDSSILPDPDHLPEPPRRVILHWTAGAHQPTLHDRRHYHALIGLEDGEVRFYRGVPLQNNCRDLGMPDPTFGPDHPGGYAPHTARLNSYSMGVALCGMAGAERHPFDPGPEPIIAAQVEAMVECCAQVAYLYGLEPAVDRFFTHWEADHVHGVSQPGKWDITVLPDDEGGWRDLPPRKVGTHLRRRIEYRLKDYR